MTDKTKTGDWPYDADRNDPLTALRIPVVDTHRPQWAYLVALDTDALPGEDWPRPTDQEALQLQSFLREYIERWYFPYWQERLAERPFDIDGDANGTIFRKYGEGDWAYRKDSWQMGPMYFPVHPRVRQAGNPGPFTLVQVMDHIHGARGDEEVRPYWADWKAAHPEVFGQGQA
jgi:hypothetical protein